MLPQTFQEVLIRLYCKKESYRLDENGKKELLNQAFIKWIKLNKDLYSIPSNAE
jgi:hypothetical protein